MGLGVVFAGLVGLNVYVFLFGRGTSVQDVLQSGVMMQPAPAQTEPPLRLPVTKPSAADDGIRRIQGAVRPGDGLGPLLRREGVSPAQAEALIRALRPLFDPRQVRSGQSYRIDVDRADGAVRAFDLVVSPVETLRVQRGPEGDFAVARQSRDLSSEVVTVAGVIERSLHEAVEAVGEDPSLITFFVDVFSWDIDFYVDQHPGDRFRVVVEKRSLDGEFYEWGRVLAAEYSGRVGNYRVFLHEGADGRASYYDEKGQSAQRSLLKSPLKYVRITSRFGKRFHPVLHRTKGHMGVDFAAPTGTPVRATADGRVVHAGYDRGSGNMVAIAHPGGVTSLYMHLQRFAKGLKQGQAVEQRQVIGFVGTTGLSTGPHLHFGLKKDGRYIDPLRQRGAPGRSVPRVELAAFRAAIEPHRAALAALDPQRPQRQGARGLTILR